MQMQETKTPSNKYPFIPLLFLFYFGFYVLTCCRSVGWVDASAHARYVYKLEIGYWVNKHNLFILLGNLWTHILPWKDNIAYQLNLFSAFWGAVTVYFIFLSGLKVTQNFLASFLGSIALLFSHSLWWHSTMTEVYTLNTALLAIVIFAIAKFERTRNENDMLLASFVFGLSCVNHVLMWLFVFSFLKVAIVLSKDKERKRTQTLLKMTLCFFAGFQIYIIIFINDFVRLAHFTQFKTHNKWLLFGAIWDSATGGHFKQAMFPSYGLPFFESVKIYLLWFLNYLLTLVMNYPSPALILACVGFWAFLKKQDNRLIFFFTSLCFVINSVWVIGYHVWDQYAFGLPSWVILGLWVIVGFDYFLKVAKSALAGATLIFFSFFIGPWVYAQIPQWAHQPGFWRTYFSNFDFVSNLWDPAEYFGSPDKRRENSAQRISASILAKLPRGAIVYDSDGKSYYPLKLYYQDIYGVRPDVQYFQFFGPTSSETEADGHAARIMKQLNEGRDVFISSLYWPELMIIRSLYKLTEHKEPDKDLMEFTQIKFKKIPLLEGQPYCIYQIVKNGS